MFRFEEWTLDDGQRRRVAVIRRYLCGEDVCPECGRAIIAAVATAPERGQVFRLECLFCPWKTEALPDPERKRELFKQPECKGNKP
jgi:hypothetical protein